MHLITGRNVQEHQILLAVINLPYIVKAGGEIGGEKGNKGHKETNMARGWVVRSKLRKVSENPGGRGKGGAMTDDI